MRDRLSGQLISDGAHPEATPTTLDTDQRWSSGPKLMVNRHPHPPLSSINPPLAGPSQAEILLRVTSAIAAELIRSHDANESVSLNELRAKMSKKFGFGGVPRLVDIISAIPDDYKKALLPKLRARPIRTASGVCLFHDAVCPTWCLLSCCLDRGGCGHVQAPSMPAHRHDREYLCVSAFDVGSDLSLGC